MAKYKLQMQTVHSAKFEIFPKVFLSYTSRIRHKFIEFCWHIVIILYSCKAIFVFGWLAIPQKFLISGTYQSGYETTYMCHPT